MTADKTFTNAKREAWDKISDAKDDVENAAHRAGKKVRNYIDSAGDELVHASDSVKTQIRNKPVQSSVIALAIGFVIGTLLGR